MTKEKCGRRLNTLNTYVYILAGDMSRETVCTDLKSKVSMEGERTVPILYQRTGGTYENAESLNMLEGQKVSAIRAGNRKFDAPEV
jgi:hypothetical protein